MKEKLRRLTGLASEKFEVLLDISKSLLYYSILFSLVFNLLLFISIFMYGTFYFAFLPVPDHEGPIYPVFEPCEEKTGRCGFLNGTVIFSDRDPILMTGQAYTVSVLIEMPESPVNRNLGMFMNCLRLKTVENHVIRENCKSGLMQYRSELLRVIETFVFAPVLLSGHSTEKQFLRIDFLEDYMDNPLRPAVKLELEVQSRFIETYSIQFQIHAKFMGLRYLMFYHPFISAFVGIGLNMTFLSTLILLSWYRFFSTTSSDENEEDTRSRFDQDEDVVEEEIILGEESVSSDEKDSEKSFQATEDKYRDTDDIIDDRYEDLEHSEAHDEEMVENIGTSVEEKDKNM